MTKQNLFKLASSFETKLNSVESKTPATKTKKVASEPFVPETVKENKQYKKVAKLEQTIRTKIAKQQAEVQKYSSSPTVKTASGTLPAIFVVCQDCHGHGKVAKTTKPANVKLASASEYMHYYSTEKCSTCKGNRVIKIADMTKCSKEEVEASEDFKAMKKAEKKQKKATKKQKKAERAIKKAMELRVKADDPDEFEKMEKKIKCEKKAHKAEKKAVKAKKKADRANASI